MHKLLLFAVFLAGCQTLQKRSEHIVGDRAAKLKNLSAWKSTWCQIDAELTEPAKARYQQMFPFEGTEDLTYAWRSRESSCEVTPLGPSSIAKSHQAFLETALCLLMQVHYVNSPFDELDLKSANIKPVGELTHIKAGENPELGIFLPHDSMTVETRTKSRGILRAVYEGASGEMLPKRLEQERAGTMFVVDEIDFDPSDARPMLKSFWISAGSEKPVRHSKAIIRDCRPL